MADKGRLFVVSAPYGAGKTSLIKVLAAMLDNLYVSVSHTTREARPGERDGVDYHFISEKTFFDMQKSGDFLESAKVFNNYYGTSSSWVEENLGHGKDIILEIDWQGALQVQKHFTDCTKIFILPPSREVLEQRLMDRAQDDDDVINARMQEAKNEISHYVEYDYLVVNDNFDDSLKALESIVLSSRLTYDVQANSLEGLINNLLN